MTYKELIDTVILDLDESSTDTDLVNKIKNYINRGYIALSKKEILETTTNSTITNNRVRKPDNAIKILNVLIDEVPVVWRVEGQYIIVQSEGRCKIVYNCLPEKLVNDTDETETNEANVEYIINYAKWLYHLSEDDEEQAKLYKVEYEGMDLVLNQSSFQKITDVYGVI